MRMDAFYVKMHTCIHMCVFVCVFACAIVFSRRCASCAWRAVLLRICCVSACDLTHGVLYVLAVRYVFVCYVCVTCLCVHPQAHRQVR